VSKLPPSCQHKAIYSHVVGPDRVDSSNALLSSDLRKSKSQFLTPPIPAPSKPAAVTPLAPARYKVEFTARAELRDKLERLKALMPDADLAAIIEEEVTEKLERLESKRLGKTKTPRKSLSDSKKVASSRYIPAAVRRAVHKRDNGQCTYVDPSGRRCKERHRLEFDHRKPYGRGGDHSVRNLRLLCRTHNGYLAEREYGKKLMEHHRQNGRSARNLGRLVTRPP
jgi:5-methylcytosine-specific restriction endonuclease McrA